MISSGFGSRLNKSGGGRIGFEFREVKMTSFVSGQISLISKSTMTCLNGI